LEFIVPEGQVLYIPPFWWYSIRFPGPNVFAYSFTYWSAMNWLSNGDIWARYLWAIQSDTVNSNQRKLLSIRDTEELNLMETVKTKTVEMSGDENIVEMIENIEENTPCSIAAVMESEIAKEELKQKEDPIFQSLVIPT
jgi:hypothetical protein